MTPACRTVLIGPHQLPGILEIGRRTAGLVIFCHGSGSSRSSPRNRYVAQQLRENGLATLAFDLLKPQEAVDREKVFDIQLLAARVAQAVDWVADDPQVQSLPISLFGASTGAAAALVVAARLGPRIRSVVSRGGRPDLAMEALNQVVSPTLLIVGGEDRVVLQLNREALTLLGGPKELVVVPGATHLFEEPGTLDTVVDHAASWFLRSCSGAKVRRLMGEGKSTRP